MICSISTYAIETVVAVHCFSVLRFYVLNPTNARSNLSFDEKAVDDVINRLKSLDSYFGHFDVQNGC